MGIGVASYSIGAFAFVVLAALSLGLLRHHSAKWLFFTASITTALWAAASAYGQITHLPRLTHFSELLADLVWISLLLYILKPAEGNVWFASALRPLSRVIIITWTLLLLLDVYLQFDTHFYITISLENIWFYEYLLLSIFGLVLIEQLLRNSDDAFVWVFKFFAIGLGAQFAYDLFLYSDAVLFGGVNQAFWDVRGVLIALLVPLLVTAMARFSNVKQKVYISRTLIFHGVSLIGAGLYLLFMAGVALYIQQYGGEWGTFVQIIFLFAAALLLLALVFSGKVRSYFRVILSKHFFRYKYDYRSEWLRFMTFFSEGENSDIKLNVIVAIARIVDSPGAALWLNYGGDGYRMVKAWDFPGMPDNANVGLDSLIQFMVRTNWVIDLCEYREHPGRYEDVEFPNWLLDMPDARLILPLMHRDELSGFLVLSQPRADREFNWEDRDLLKTVGRQAAGYLALMMTSQMLHEVRQFDAFNRLSAFVVHDLKNVVAQLSLMLRNAEKHKENPAFIDDALLTVDNSVNKMKRLLEQLKSDRSDDASATRVVKVRLRTLLDKMCSDLAIRKPYPLFKCEGEGEIYTGADSERLYRVLAHLVQNAQEATDSDGRVEITLQQGRDNAVIVVDDTGSGMTANFIRERLFKPFETTKGNAGMGVGVYETKEYIQSLGGKVEVSSEVGIGTQFVVTLPILNQEISE